MNLWLRLLATLFAAFRGAGIDSPLGVSRLRFTVLPHDLDTSMHMNNGRYWTLMDLGRVDLILRTGLWRHVLKRRWTPVATAGQIRFRRELRLFERFDLETQVVAWSGPRLVIEHRVVRRDGSVAAIALVQTGLYDRAARSFVEMDELMRLTGRVAESPALRPDVEAFLASDAVLKATTAAAAPDGGASAP